MTLANKLSVFRMLLVPVFVACLIYYRPDRDWLRVGAVVLFLVGALTDAVDGLIARTTGQQSELGSFLDPMADKLMLVSAFIALAALPSLPAAMRIPPWLTLLVLSRDIFLLLGSVVVYLITNRLKITPSPWGKWATVCQMSLVLAALLLWPLARWLWFPAAALTVASGVGYLRDGTRLLVRHMSMP